MTKVYPLPCNQAVNRDGLPLVPKVYGILSYTFLPSPHSQRERDIDK